MKNQKKLKIKLDKGLTKTDNNHAKNFSWIDDREAEGTPLLREHTSIKLVSRVRIPLYPPVKKSLQYFKKLLKYCAVTNDMHQ